MSYVKLRRHSGEGWFEDAERYHGTTFFDTRVPCVIGPVTSFCMSEIGFLCEEFWRRDIARKKVK